MCSREDVSGIVRRLRRQVAGYPLRLADGTEDYVTATFGGAMLDLDIELHENIDRAVLAGRFGMKLGGDTDQMWAPSLKLVVKPAERLPKIQCFLWIKSPVNRLLSNSLMCK